MAFRKAVREQTSLLIGIAGPSGSGKTYSALRLATGLAEGGPIFMIDTESRRGLHYAESFDYQYSELSPPFEPHRYLEVMQEAKKAGAKVVVVDSMSHEHEGPGGILEMHENALEKMAGSDWAKRERVKFTAWIQPKAEHNKFVNGILQLGIHVIYCFRAKEKLALIKNDKGKMEPVPQGWQPICADRFQYECLALLMLPPNSNGVPDQSAEAFKIQGQHRHLFPVGKQIDEDMGKRLAAWAAGGGKAKKDTARNPGYVFNGIFGVENLERPSEWLAAMESGIKKCISEGASHDDLWANNLTVFTAIGELIQAMKPGKRREKALAQYEGIRALGEDAAEDADWDATESDGPSGDDPPPHTDDSAPAAPPEDWAMVATEVRKVLVKVGSDAKLYADFAAKYSERLERMKTEAPQVYGTLDEMLAAKKTAVKGS